ncbi:MAG: ABC transporter permease [Halobacteriales archaeon]
MGGQRASRIRIGACNRWNRWGRWLNQTRAFAGRHLRQYARSRVSLLFIVAWPAFWYLLIVHLLFMTDGPTAEAVTTAKAAFAVSFGLFGVFTVALTGVISTFTADIATKRYRKFRSLPLSPAADLAGRATAGVGLSIASYVALLAIGFVDGAAFSLRHPWSPAVVLLGVVSFAAIGVVIAIALASVVPRPEYATTGATALLLASFFGTGFNGVSPALFPGPAWLLNVVPVSLITRLQLHHVVAPAAPRSATFAPPALPAGPPAVGMVALYGLAAVSLGVLVIDWGVYRGEAGE